MYKREHAYHRHEWQRPVECVTTKFLFLKQIHANDWQNVVGYPTGRDQQRRNSAVDSAFSHAKFATDMHDDKMNEE